MAKTLPVHAEPPPSGRYSSKRRSGRLLALVLLTALGFISLQLHAPNLPTGTLVPPHLGEVIKKCRALHTPAGVDEALFHKRTHSDRFVPGTKPTLIRNARIWTGNSNGTEVINGSILLDRGMIKALGRVPHISAEGPYKDLVVVDANGAWVTPGIVDVHSHIGDASSPALEGATDDNSIHGITQPWLRSLDGLNTHDESYTLSVAGGVTTALVLPGSANAIGGQAFTIKLRKTAERTSTSLLLEPPFQINGSAHDGPPRWRYLKQACGENPSGVYNGVRMDTIWSFRQAYDAARKIRDAQDDYCERVLAHEWSSLGDYPESLQWEALVDVLRGRVKVQTHCYEAVDIDALVRLSQEFKFPLSAIHHASEAYLVPDLLKSAYGKTPAVALFATNSRYKREAYRSSEFAPRILTKEGIQVVMKSDHPVNNERDLIYEAAQAFYYGFPANVALASVTSTSASVLGMDHRIGYVREGWDADLVVWDSYPLALGATPKQVFIDGIPQLKNSFVLNKPKTFQEVPAVPNFDKEAQDAIDYEGLPPLAPTKAAEDVVFFTNVKDVFVSTEEGVEHAFTAQDQTKYGTVIVVNGSVACFGAREECVMVALENQARFVDLKGGSIQPGLSSFGAPLGMQEIDQEPSTGDGIVFDPLLSAAPAVLGGAIIKAVDGLSFQGRDMLHAYRAGVTTAISAPSSYGFYSGLSTHFSLGAAHKLAHGAIVQEVAALHVSISMSSSTASVSTQVGTLRRLLLHGGPDETGKYFKDAGEGKITLAVKAQSADIIATLISLKKEVETVTNKRMHLTIVGAAEAHLLAKELAESRVGVVLVPFRSFPFEWESRRILPGPPLTEKSSVQTLLDHNVITAVGVLEAWDARNTRFYAAWAALEGHLSKRHALALGGANLQRLLGGGTKASSSDLVATEGGDLLSFGAKVAAVVSPNRALVDLF